MKNKSAIILGMVLAAGTVVAQQGVTSPQKANRPQGFRFLNNHLTIKPYVSLDYTYDSNVTTERHAKDDSIFAVMPGADFQWNGEKWALMGNLWYRYRHFCEHSSTLGENSFGESLSFNYASAPKNEKGWALMLTERYGFYNQSDDIMSRDGRGVWRDREVVDLSGVVQRRFTERWHASALGQYSQIDYKNDTGSYVPLYGWSQYSGGAQFGFVATKWTDLLLAAGYSRYLQKSSSYYSPFPLSRQYSNNSDSYSIQAGIGSHMTELITYRALMGCSWFDYGGNSAASDCGWTYTLSANWRIHRQVQLSVMGSSYYQPSERVVGQAMKVYTLGTGVSYLTLGDRLRLSANLSWRFDEVAYSDDAFSGHKRYDYDESWLSARFGGDYLLNRWTSLFAYVVWDETWCDNDNDNMNYDRFRGTVGVKFHY